MTTPAPRIEGTDPPNVFDARRGASNGDKTPGGDTINYRAVIAAVVIMFSIGALYAWSVFIEPLESQLRIPRATTSLVFSLATCCFTVSMLLGPRLYPYARAPWIALSVFALAAIGFALAAWGSSIWSLGFGFGVLFGVANGLGYGLSIQLVQLAMPTHRGLGTGLVVASYTLGAAVFAPAFALGIRSVGISSTFAITAVVMLSTGILAWLLIGASKAELHDPSKTGKIRPGHGERPVFWKLWVGFLLGGATGMLALGHAAAMVASFGATVQQLVAGASLVAIGNGVGRLAGGWLSDLVKPRLILSGMQLLAGISLLVVIVLPGVETAMLALTVVGVGYGCMAGAYPVVISHLYGAPNVSRIYGRVFTAWGLAAVGAPYLGGVLYDLSGHYHIAIGLAAATALGAALVCFTLPEPPMGRGSRLHKL